VHNQLSDQYLPPRKTDCQRQVNEYCDVIDFRDPENKVFGGGMMSFFPNAVSPVAKQFFEIEDENPENSKQSVD
jgi:hypothetical protein